MPGSLASCSGTERGVFLLGLLVRLFISFSGILLRLQSAELFMVMKLWRVSGLTGNWEVGVVASYSACLLLGWMRPVCCLYVGSSRKCQVLEIRQATQVRDPSRTQNTREPGREANIFISM